MIIYQHRFNSIFNNTDFTLNLSIMSETSFEPANQTSAFGEIRLCCEALDNKKAECIQVLDVRGISSVTDFMIICTGTSQPHLKALRAEVEKTLKDSGIKTLGADFSQESGWMVVDCFDFMVHIFTQEMREAYGLEKLWKDAACVDWQA